MVYSFISGQRWGPLKVPFRIYEYNLQCVALHFGEGCKPADESESTAELMLGELLWILQLISKFIIKAGRYCVDHIYQNTITLGVFAPQNPVITKRSHGDV